MTQITFTNYPIRGIDVSRYQDNTDTEFMPDVSKARDAGCSFIIARSSYGVVMDKLFPHFHTTSKGILKRGLYHYLDYYSYGGLGLTLSQWGIKQAEFIWGLIKDDPCPVFIDVENAGSFARPIREVWTEAMTILAYLLRRMDELTGKVTGIYASTGNLIRFPDNMKWRPLFAANYNPISVEYLKELVRDAGWTDLLIWQYISDGDIDEDGIGDGKLLGMETAAVDLDIWLAGEDRFNEFFAGEDEPLPDPDEPLTEMHTLRTVKTQGLRIRREPRIAWNILDKLDAGEVVEVMEEETNGGLIWARIGHDQWACRIEGNTEHME